MLKYADPAKITGEIYHLEPALAAEGGETSGVHRVLDSARLSTTARA